MSSDIVLGNYILGKYSQLTNILDDLIRAHMLGDGLERAALLDGIKQQTNHSGLHMTVDELAMLFLNRPADAFDVMRDLGLGISNDDFESCFVAE